MRNQKQLNCFTWIWFLNRVRHWFLDVLRDDLVDWNLNLVLNMSVSWIRVRNVNSDIFRDSKRFWMRNVYRNSLINRDMDWPGCLRMCCVKSFISRVFNNFFNIRVSVSWTGDCFQQNEKTKWWDLKERKTNDVPFKFSAKANEEFDSNQIMYEEARCECLDQSADFNNITSKKELLWNGMFSTRIYHKTLITRSVRTRKKSFRMEN